MKLRPLIYYGSQEPPAPARVLRAGSLTCLYLAGAIRQVGAGGTQILNMIYPAIRDRNWGTVPFTISGEQIKVQQGAFSIRYQCRYTKGDIDYLAEIRISGAEDNSLVFSMQGEALSGFLKNRLGLNILHPIRECAGRACRVTTPEGTQYQADFPLLVSPRQPMKNIRALSWTPGDDIHATLTLSGEVFEMEDQRNWTDASYKTYCTPLELPFPVRVEKGDTHAQEVRLKVQVPHFHEREYEENRVTLPETGALRPFPALGICRSGETAPLGMPDAALIKAAGFMHYRTDLHLYRPGWSGILTEGAQEAAGMGLALEVGLFFDGEPLDQLPALVRQLQGHGCPVARFLVFNRKNLNDDDLSAAVIPVLKKAFPLAMVGTGTNANFAELNRHRPDPELPDFLVYAIHPQAHAFDPLSLVENLAGQPDTVMTARSFAADKPICVSPVTLKSRFNIVATSDEADHGGGDALPDSTDPRQPSLFCAGWTLGSFKYLSEAGVASITYYETAGRGGIIHGDHPPLSPQEFAAERGDIYPVYFLFRELLKLRHCRVRVSESSHPLRFSAVWLEDRQHQVLILANHTAGIQSIRFPEGWQAEETWLIDEHTITHLRGGKDAWQSTADPTTISLNPCAIAFLKMI